MDLGTIVVEKLIWKIGAVLLLVALIKIHDKKKKYRFYWNFRVSTFKCLKSKLNATYNTQDEKINFVWKNTCIFVCCENLSF